MTVQIFGSIFLLGLLAFLAYTVLLIRKAIPEPKNKKTK